ncbi:hypothetical protein KBY96_02285 [Cyanobium sp. ATX 6A2]|uniref:hypothetical protein n=1 Tax=Cyanobium sp. ATX 6A2 TaxID=2823700 RepID=UPI0020CE0F40|nr:hypothetical protein [Cyanobium sp. ATX 6A2]MCP9886766.1 hypothetical protein [Cyanobium sp. ATX 6A2]
MTTVLTPDGWFGATRGSWNRRTNRVIDERRGVRTDGRDLINALDGDDVITGQTNNSEPGFFSDRGNLQLGPGDDLLIGRSRNGIGINNEGFIFMGPGDDRIEASGGDGAIRNRRFIFMQDGNDVVDVRDGGIRGRGFIDMGQGRDTFIGFGQHTVFGSENDRDTLQLPRGRYEVSRRGGGRRGREVRIERNDDRLRLFDFDEVGAIDSRRRDRIEIDQSGTLAVRRDGTVEFV